MSGLSPMQKSPDHIDVPVAPFKPHIQELNILQSTQTLLKHFFAQEKFIDKEILRKRFAIQGKEC